MRYTSYRFIEVTELPREIRDKIQVEILNGKIRVITEHATGKEYVDGKELHKILGLEHGIAGYVNAD